MKEPLEQFEKAPSPTLQSSWKTPQNNNWYRELYKPKLTPPNWVFPIVWTILYICIAISGFLYFNTTGFVRTTGGIFYLIQLALNLAWSPLFFGKKMIRAALVDLILMWIFILLTILWFLPVNKTAGYLLCPYLIWVSLAFYLNVYIVIHNPPKTNDKNH